MPRASRLLTALICLLVLLLRRPEARFHADFWAEDGWHWYPEAATLGWRSLFTPYAGYLQTICRVVALLAQPFPLLWAPTLFAASALCIQIAVVLLLLSHRLDAAWPSRAARILFAGFYLLLPNAFEVYANLTNAQWHLALIGFLLLVASRPATRLGRLIDAGGLCLCGLSGPFCLFLAPVALWQVLRGCRLGNLVILAACCAVQAGLAIEAGRGAAPLLGASATGLADIIGLQIIAGTVLGRHAMPAIMSHSCWIDGRLPIVLTMIAAFLSAWAVKRGGTLLRQFILFATCLFAAGLLRPATGSALPAWPLFATPDIGDRYYMIPMLAWLGILFTLAASAGVALRLAAMALLAMVALAIPGDLHFATPLAQAPPTDFDRQARRFDNAPPGTMMAFPLHPQGATPMRLTKPRW